MKSSQAQRPPSSEDRSFSSIIHELGNGFQNLLKSEIHLIRAEFTENTKKIGKHSALAAGFGVIALLGLLPLCAFMVIGLGNLLGGKYWLSSLIVGLTFIGIGALLAFHFARKLKTDDLLFPHTRSSLQNETEMMREKVHEIRHVIQGRRS